MFRLLCHWQFNFITQPLVSFASCGARVISCFLFKPLDLLHLFSSSCLLRSSPLSSFFFDFVQTLLGFARSSDHQPFPFSPAPSFFFIFQGRVPKIIISFRFLTSLRAHVLIFHFCSSVRTLKVSSFDSLFVKLVIVSILLFRETRASWRIPGGRTS